MVERLSTRPMAVGALMLGVSGTATLLGWLAARSRDVTWTVALGGVLVLAVVGAAVLERIVSRWRQAEELRWQVVQQAADDLRARATAVALAASLLRRRGGVSPVPGPVDHTAPPASEPVGGAGLRDGGDGEPNPASTGPRVADLGSAATSSSAAGRVSPHPSREGVPSRAADRHLRERGGLQGVRARANGMLRGSEVPAPAPRHPSPPAAFSLPYEDQLRGQIWATLEAEAELLRVGSLQLAHWLLFERGPLGGERKRVDLAALAERCVRRLTLTATARHAPLRFIGAPGPASVVKGDRALLELLCDTMVAAAVDRALPGSGVQVEVWGDGAGVALKVTGEAPGLHGNGGAVRGRREPGHDLQAQLARKISRWHRGEWHEVGDQPFCWQVVLPAAHGPLSMWPGWPPRDRAGDDLEPGGAPLRPARKGRFAGRRPAGSDGYLPDPPLSAGSP